MKSARVLITSLLFTVCFFLFAATPSFAQTTVNNYVTPNTNPDVPTNLHTWTQNVMIEVLSATVCQLAGFDPVNPNQKCLGSDPKTGKIGFVEGGGGAIGLAGGSLMVLFNPPIHTGDYFNYLAQNFGLAKPAYAQQGTGFSSLSPLISVWSVFRNIVYLIFVVLFVIVGLAIMLRIKIDPRTVMSIENQIPKIIVGLLLVTFSFAIAGFLIDLMWVVIYLVYSVISSTNVKDIAQLKPAAMYGQNPLGAIGGLGGMNDITNTVAVSVKDIAKDMLGISSDWKNYIPVFNSLEDLGNILKLKLTDDTTFISTLINLVSNIAGFITIIKVLQIPNFTVLGNTIPITPALAIPAGIASMELVQFSLREILPWAIAYVVIFVALLWALIRLWFQLLTAYIYILLDVLLAPFWIAFGLLPGVSVGFGAWLRDIVANLSAFPVTIGMFLLGKVFMEAIPKTSNTFVPPLVGNPADPALLGKLIALGIILMTPQVVSMMKDLLKSPQLKQSAAIGQAVGVGASAINLPKHAQQLGMATYYSGQIKHIPFIGSFLGKPGDRTGTPGKAGQ